MALLTLGGRLLRTKGMKSLDKRVKYLLVYIVIAIIAGVVAVSTIIKATSGETREPAAGTVLVANETFATRTVPAAGAPLLVHAQLEI